MVHFACFTGQLNNLKNGQVLIELPLGGHYTIQCRMDLACIQYQILDWPLADAEVIIELDYTHTSTGACAELSNWATWPFHTTIQHVICVSLTLQKSSLPFMLVFGHHPISWRPTLKGFFGNRELFITLSKLAGSVEA